MMDGYRDLASGVKFLDWILSKVRKLGRDLAVLGLALWYCMKDPETPYPAKAFILGDLAYLISPVDAIPDFTPVVGYSDDMALLSAAVTLLGALLKSEHFAAANRKFDEWFSWESI